MDLFNFELRDLAEIDNKLDFWGGKAVYLRQMVVNGFNVPKGFVISSSAYVKFYTQKAAHVDFVKAVKCMIKKYFNEKSEIIFRSSANVENHDGFAFCGVFKSTLYNSKVDLFSQINTIWESANTPYAKICCGAANINCDDIKMSVIVQKIVRGHFSVVIHSYDIINDIDRIIVEYTDGAINSIVDGKVNSKMLMIDRHGCCSALNENDKKIFNEYLISKMMREVKKIESVFGGHVEIEAQIDRDSIAYLQVRKINTEGYR